jgi:hypothetical protein
MSQPYSDESWRGSDKHWVGNTEALSDTQAEVDLRHEGTQAKARAMSHTSER